MCMFDSFKMAKAQKKLKNIRKKSNCWLFYRKTDKGGSCRICKKEISSNGNTTNLINHMKRKHTIQWEASLDFNDDVDSSDEEEKESNEFYRSPKNETQHGLAYRSADGRTVIWLHPDVQLDQLSLPGFQPQITLVGQTPENRNFPESTSTDPGEQKNEESFMDVATELEKEEDSVRDVQNTETNSDEKLQMTDTFIVDVDEVVQTEDAVITNSGEVCQVVTVVTSPEEFFKENLSTDSLAKVTDANHVLQTVTVTSPQKVIVSHATSSNKSKKERSKKRCKHSQEDKDIFENESHKKGAYHVDSLVSGGVFKGQGSSRIGGELPREDSFDHFGKYIATLLRNLPSRRSAFRLQKEMLNWVLKEQMFYEQ